MRPLLILSLFAATAAHAATVEHTDRAAYFAGVGAVTTVDFTGLLYDEVIYDQWAAQGVMIPSEPTAYGPATVLFPQDGWGTIQLDVFVAELDAPATSVAIDFAGEVRIELYDDTGALVHSSSTFGSGGGSNPTTGLFAGLVSTVPFTRVHVVDVADNVPNIDDLHVGWSTGPALSIGGTCPGPVQVSMTDLTPNGNVAVVRAAAAGSAIVPGGPCVGTPLDLAAPLSLIGIFPADAAGNFSVSPTLGAAACGKQVQIIDLTTCDTSNLITL
jgi:hypothetical protein